MTNKQSDQEILKRLRELEEENARLCAVTRKQENKLIVTEGEYKGHPTLTFEGPMRRFTLGLSKLRALKEAWPLIESFLERHEKTNDSHDEIKI